MALKSLSFSLLVVSVKQDSLDGFTQELAKKREIAPDFFHLAPLVVKVENDEFEIDALKLKQLVIEQNFLLVGVTGNLSETQKEAFHAQGIAILKSSKFQQAKEVVVSSKSEQTEDNETIQAEVIVEKALPLVTPEIKAKVHDGRVRSGQQVYAKDSDLVINGNVSAGAEVIADGNIYIYGALSGKAIAGAMGDLKAKVYCYSLSSELISIAGIYKLNDALPSEFNGKSCIVGLHNEEITFTQFCQI